MKTILLFADGLTYPGKEGVSQHVIGLLMALSKVDNIRPVLLMCDRGTISQTQLRNLPWSTVLVSHSTYYNYSKIKNVINKIRPDILQSYSVYQARLISSRYSIEYRIPLVMEHHDVDEEFIDNYSLASEARNYQLDLIELASLNRTLSSRDAKILMKYSPSRSFTFVNIPSTISLDLDRQLRAPDHILFIGNGAYPPNKKALNYIQKNLAPRLPHITFHLVGRLTENYDAANDNVVGYGMIDDISQVISKVGFGIAPLEKGSGLKIKVMTYLSAGLPVIGTKIAFQGYKDSPALIQAELSDFADILSKQVKNYNANLSNFAKEEYTKNYRNDVHIDKIIQIYDNLKYDALVSEINSDVIYYDSINLPWLKEFREKEYTPCKETTYINFTLEKLKLRVPS